MSIPLLVTVVETPEFIARTDKLMVDEDRQVLIDYLAQNPTAGDLIPVAKNERADLSQEDRNTFRRLTKLLVETYGRKGR